MAGDDTTPTGAKWIYKQESTPTRCSSVDWLSSKYDTTTAKSFVQRGRSGIHVRRDTVRAVAEGFLERTLWVERRCKFG